MPATIEPIEFHGQPALRLATASGARAVVALHGAQVLSWAPPGGEERLYLSPKAVFDGHSAVRGGIPVCFPQFADLGPLDLLGAIEEGLDYEQLQPRSRTASIEGHSVLVLDLAEIVRLKRASAHPKDAAMLPLLEETLRRRP